MRESMLRALCAGGLTVLATSAPTALAGGSGGAGEVTITDGDASYTFRNSGTDGRADWIPGGPLTTSQTFESWWWFRVDEPDATGREFALGNGRPDNADVAGNSVTFSGTEEDAGLDYAITWTVDGTTNRLLTDVTVTNITDEPLTLNLFQYSDIDFDGSASDSVDVDGTDTIDVTNAGTPGLVIRYRGFGADAFQVGSPSAINGLLDDADVDDLDNSGAGLSFTNIAAAFQWSDVVVPAGEDETFRVGFVVIPSPGPAAALALAGVGAIGRRRRRA